MLPSVALLSSSKSESNLSQFTPLLEKVPESRDQRAESVDSTVSDELVLKYTPSGILLESEENSAVFGAMKNTLAGVFVETSIKRGIFEWAINNDQKPILNRLLFELRDSGEQAFLQDTDLSALNLSDLDLSGVNAATAIFSNSNLDRTNLSGANLTRADVSGTSMMGTKVDKTIFNCTIANGLRTDNSWLAKSHSRMSDTFAENVQFSNSYLNGIGEVSCFNKKTVIVPGQKLVGSCCSCLIL